MSKFLKHKALLILILLGLASIVAALAPTYFKDPPWILSYNVQTEKDTLVPMHQVASGTYVVHLWATWCGPCIKELPELSERMASGEGDPPIIPLALDGHDKLDRVEAFLAEHNLTNIPAYTANMAEVRSELFIRNLPVSIFFEDDQELGRVEGVIDWQAPLPFYEKK